MQPNSVAPHCPKAEDSDDWSTVPGRNSDALVTFWARYSKTKQGGAVFEPLRAVSKPLRAERESLPLISPTYFAQLFGHCALTMKESVTCITRLEWSGGTVGDEG